MKARVGRYVPPRLLLLKTGDVFETVNIGPSEGDPENVDLHADAWHIAEAIAALHLAQDHAALIGGRLNRFAMFYRIKQTQRLLSSEGFAADAVKSAATARIAREEARRAAMEAAAGLEQGCTAGSDHA